MCTYTVHLQYLATVSRYFRAMLATDNFAESHLEEVPLPDVKVEHLKLYLMSVYPMRMHLSGKLSFDDVNASPLL